MMLGQKIFKDEDGQGMTEYVIIVALVAIAAIFAIKVFGTQIREGFYTIAQALYGDEKATQMGIGEGREGLVDSAGMKDFSAEGIEVRDQ